ncbi:MAG: smalltalk protein [Prevotella sp.]|nr:smalltalk protein [Prevotella sp.]
MKWNRETWKFVVQTVLAILSAIATSLGVTSCMSSLIG